MMKGGILHRLELIRSASSDIRSEIRKILEKDDRISIATVMTEAYAQDLYQLMRRMAEEANPVLEEMGLNREAIEHDIQEYVAILQDNERQMYFASVNLEAKYSKNKYALGNLARWFGRLEDSIERIEGYLESETERKELKRLFGRLDKSGLSSREKEKLKQEFLHTLNRLNRR